MRKIILASNSPRRKELLKDLGYSFEVQASDIDEEIDSNNLIKDEIENLSFKKANSVFKNYREYIVIGADTIVTFKNKVYGKPKNEKEAIKMLQELRNNKHMVITAVTILSKYKSETFSSCTEVVFGDITDDEIHKYVNSENVLDKAGAYAIQGLAKKYIKSINGDYYTVVGLPIYELNKRLKKYNG